MGDIIGGVASLASGIMGANAAKSAASKEQAIAQQGIDFQKGIYGTASTNLSPYISGGQSALNTLLGFYGLGPNPQGATAGFNQFQQTPFYQFPLQQGMLGVNRALAASGLIGSGAAVKEGAQFASGLASQGLGTYLSGLSGLSGSGLNAATSLGQIGTGVGRDLSQLYTGQAAAVGGGITGANNALTQGLQGLVGPLSAFGNGLIGTPQGGSSYSGAYGAGSKLGGWLGLGGGTATPVAGAQGGGFGLGGGATGTGIIGGSVIPQ